MDGWLLGERFVPSDIEIIAYLRMREEGSPIPSALIYECDVYEKEPWNLPRDFKHGIKEEVYYFTPRHRASAKVSGCRVNRNAGEGFWHGNSRDQLIFDPKSQNSGHKTSLVFKFKNNKRGRLHTNWIMHEYILHSPDGKFQEIALCRITPKRENKEVGDHHLATYGSEKIQKHTTMLMPLFDQAQEVSSDGVAKVTAPWTEQETTSQLMPLPGLAVDSAIDTIPSSTIDTFDSDLLNWIDSADLAPLPSPTSAPFDSQQIEMNNADVLEWIDSYIAIENSIDSAIDTNPSSTFDSFDSDILNWIDSPVLASLPSPMSIPFGSRHIEMNNDDALQWIDSSIAIENSIVAQSSPFATGCPINDATISDASGWVGN